jgi:hypothetical protein
MLTSAMAGLPPLVNTYKPSSWFSISATIRENLSRASVSGTIRSIGTLIWCFPSMYLSFSLLALFWSVKLACIKKPDDCSSGNGRILVMRRVWREAVE